MKKEQNTSIPFRLVNITTEEFATFKDHFRGHNKEYDIELSAYVKANAETHLLGLYTRFTFQQEDQPILVLESACHFHLDDSFWSENTVDDKLVLPVKFATHLLMLSVGTARGIIHAKKPAWLDGYVLGTVDVSQLFGNEDLVIELSDDNSDSE
jgi:hypothetical protein